MPPIYLDYNATSPVRPEAARAVAAALEQVPGNPSSTHAFGAAARDLVVRARREVAAAAGVAPETILFTSGATESNNAVLCQAARRTPGGRVVTCATEHPSVLEMLRALAGGGLRTALVPVGTDGRVDPARFAAELQRGDALATLMWANNETGVVQPIAELARLAAERGVPFHT